MQNLQNTKITWVDTKVPLLDRIIKKINETSGNQSNEIVDKVVVQYDRKTGIALKEEDRKFSLGSLFKHKKPVEYYLVDTYQHSTIAFSHEYKIEHPELGNVNITIKYTVGAKPNMETTLVAVLMRRDSPSSMLEDKIKECVHKYVTDEQNILFTNFGRFSTGISKNISQRLESVGLLVETIVSRKIPDRISFPPINISVKEIQVQPRGYNDFIKLGFEALLTPDANAKDSVFTTNGYERRAEFQELMVTWMQENIRQAVSYNDITNMLHSKVRTALIEYWNKCLRDNNWGWIVGDLVLHSKDVPALNFKFERMEIEVVLRTAKIPLVNTIILNLEDAERFKNARVENLETWIKEKLQQCAQNVLAKVTYAELVSQIDSLASIIKGDIDKHAMHIGYRVEYLLTSELVDNAKMNFQFSFLEEEQIYHTTLNEKVKLDMNISGKIRNLNNDYWRNNLTPTTDFTQVMKKEVLRVVRQILLRTSADDFYTQFTNIVAPKLENAVKELLINEFNVEPSVDILPQMKLSAFLELIESLKKGYHKIEINCQNKEIASFSINFSITGVDPSKWDLFASRNYNSAELIKEAISERIRIFVEAAVRYNVSDINILRDTRFFKLIERYAKMSNFVIVEKMGLIIDIVDVDPIKNIFTELIVEKSFIGAKEKIERLLDSINETEIKLLEATIANDGDDFEIERLETKRDKLQILLKNEQFKNNTFGDQHAGKVLDKLLTAPMNMQLILENNEQPATNENNITIQA